MRVDLKPRPSPVYGVVFGWPSGRVGSNPALPLQFYGANRLGARTAAGTLGVRKRRCISSFAPFSLRILPKDSLAARLYPRRSSEIVFRRVNLRLVR
jgi:hypothetical protein